MRSILFKKISMVLLACAAMLSWASQAYGANDVRTANVSDHKLALKGYDAVAYFDQGRPISGNSRFSYVHDGIEYRFSSETNKQKFAKSPDRFMPQYGGFCSFGTSVGLKLEVDPEAFEIVDDKLYLNNSLNIHEMWLENPKGRIKAANQHWRKIKNTAAEKLTPIPFEG